MKIAVIGRGAREHVLVRALSESPSRPDVLVYPGNDGMLDLARRFDAKSSIDIVRVMRNLGVDVCVIGEEKYLEEGLADTCRAQGMAVWGPDRAAAQLETSKIFAKAFMRRHGVPTANFAITMSAADVRKAAGDLPRVLKFDGLAAGKGVSVCLTEQDVEDFNRRVFVERQFGEKCMVIVEECLSGKEISIICAVSDGRYQVFVPARDYKRLRDGDAGPNTGGMGAVASLDLISREMREEIETRIIRPTIRGLEKDGLTYRGFLYFGLMLTPDGPRVLEYNCRFGDPEAQSVFELMNGDFAAYLYEGAKGELNPRLLRISSDWAVTVVLASKDYPARSSTGDVIEGLEKISGCRVYHAGTSRAADGGWIVNGGRALSIAASAATLGEARDAVYREASKVRFNGAQMRQDIGFLHFEEALAGRR